MAGRIWPAGLQFDTCASDKGGGGSRVTGEAESFLPAGSSSRRWRPQRPAASASCGRLYGVCRRFRWRWGRSPPQCLRPPAWRLLVSGERNRKTETGEDPVSDNAAPAEHERLWCSAVAPVSFTSSKLTTAAVNNNNIEERHKTVTEHPHWHQEKSTAKVLDKKGLQ